MQPSMDIPIHEAMDALSRLAAPKSEGQVMEALRIAGLLKQIEQMSAPSDMTPHGIEEALKFIHKWAGEALYTPPAPEPRPAKEPWAITKLKIELESRKSECKTVTRERDRLRSQLAEAIRQRDLEYKRFSEAERNEERAATELAAVRSQLARKDEELREALERSTYHLRRRLPQCGKQDMTNADRDLVEWCETDVPEIIRRAALREPDGRKGE